MATLRFALAQFDFPVGAVRKNGERMRELMEQARDTHGAHLIAFPELTIAGYPPEDLLLRPSFLAACEKEVAEVAASANGIAAYFGHPHAMGEVYNAASLAIDGEVVFTTHKQALPNYTVFDEKRYFQSGSHSAVTDLNGVRIGWLICEDIWEEEPAAHAAAQGAQLLIVINASPFDTAKAAQRAELLARRARENEVAIAYVNVVGGQDDLVFDGGSLLVEADGRIAAQAPAMTDVLLIAAYDNITRRFTAYGWPAVQESLESRVYAALVRGIRDYVDKNGFPGVLLGLSGGIDSSLVLALAVDALGADRITAVRLPSRYTTDMSNDLADVQAKKLGIELLTIPIEAPFEAFVRELGPAFVQYRAGSGDVTEENLQSRCRGITLMALSNRTGRMVLSTGNKSEYAVGYATIYGDMCGGYAPIKDCYKQLVYRLSRWRNLQGDGDVIPVGVIDRPPSAELRENQTDQDSLPPYDVLDAILERFIDLEQSQAEIIAAGFDETTVRKVARLVLISEYKRRQSAPGPKISTRAFGRDRRYPITSGWR
jgi:NAD+ synthase (glutamine-hydrolysing)